MKVLGVNFFLKHSVVRFGCSRSSKVDDFSTVPIKSVRTTSY